jgi:hypothetical protein
MTRDELKDAHRGPDATPQPPQRSGASQSASA